MTLDRFREVGDEELVAAAVREWAGHEPVEIRRIDVVRGVARRTVELWLIIDIPFEFYEEVVAPSDLVPPGSNGNDLKLLLRQALGPDRNVQFRLHFRYAGVFDLKTGNQVGLSIPEQPDKGQANN